MDNTALVSKSLPSYLRRAMGSTRRIPGSSGGIADVGQAGNERIAAHMYGRRAASQQARAPGLGFFDRASMESAAQGSRTAGANKKAAYLTSTTYHGPQPKPPKARQKGYAGRDQIVRAQKVQGFDPFKRKALAEVRGREAELERRIASNRQQRDLLLAEQRPRPAAEAKINDQERALARREGRRKPPWRRVTDEEVAQVRRTDRRAAGVGSWNAPHGAGGGPRTRTSDARALVGHQAALSSNAGRYGDALSRRSQNMVNDRRILARQTKEVADESKRRIAYTAVGGGSLAVAGGAGGVYAYRNRKGAQRSPWVA